MTKIFIEGEKIQESILMTDVFKQEVNVYCDSFINANNELKKVKESSEILDIDKLKLIFGEVNIKKEWLIMNIYKLTFEEYKEIEQYLADKFTQATGPEKRAFAELKAGILNAKDDNFII